MASSAGSGQGAFGSRLWFPHPPSVTGHGALWPPDGRGLRATNPGGGASRTGAWGSPAPMDGARGPRTLVVARPVLGLGPTGPDGRGSGHPTPARRVSSD